MGRKAVQSCLAWQENDFADDRRANERQIPEEKMSEALAERPVAKALEEFESGLRQAPRNNEGPSYWCATKKTMRVRKQELIFSDTCLGNGKRNCSGKMLGQKVNVVSFTGDMLCLRN